VISSNMRGLAALQKRLENLSKEEATKAGQVANRAGAAVLRKEVIKTAPNSPKTKEGEVRTRHNKDGSTRKETHHKIVNSVKVKKTKGAKTTEVNNAVTINGAYHASFVEFGSIRNTADPFMLRALNASQDTIIETIAKVLNKQLVKRGA
jgi:HK97 gp10 family phage protein